MRPLRRSGGFTLVEIAMVLTIIGLIFGGALIGYRSFVQQAHYSQTQTWLENARMAVLNYALVRGHMPCPDTDDDGRENREGAGICNSSEGQLPWLDLGVERFTPQGDIAFYMVNRDVGAGCPADGDESRCFFDIENAPAFNLQTPPRPGSNGSGNLNIDNSEGQLVAQRVIALIGSQGTNAGVACNTLAADERENCDDDNSFIMNNMRPNPADFFDDQLVWIHANTLKGQMRDAGLL